ncbi:hypothetical protein [Commensalibacter communis]|uniref:hypothetical protein n=1 Tax=Commensalibacter communis TaxID=2972786 RepID=UPI0022FFC1F7|nr:hypothetical protein [Commensalibacter communis]CAI3934711.1 unnamed protein product [Commensalibacter communis]CAI3943509.1 unnamed protein product [Commensalibacter communis]
MLISAHMPREFIKKVVLFSLYMTGISIGAFYLYMCLFPSLDDQLFKAVGKKCEYYSCKVHLHEITPFKWDKAYFFPATRSYSNQDIKKITGISFDLQKYKTVDDQEYKTLAMFIYHGKLVKYNFFEAPFFTENDHLEDTKSQYFTILFSIDTSVYPFRNGDGFEELIEFKKNFEIAYYEITPINDLLYITFLNRKKYSNDTIREVLVIYSNLNQVHLHNP